MERDADEFHTVEKKKADLTVCIVHLLQCIWRRQCSVFGGKTLGRILQDQNGMNGRVGSSLSALSPFGLLALRIVIASQRSKV